MKQFKTFDGRTFEVLSKPTKRVISILRNVSNPWAPYSFDARTIYQAYYKPSQRKIEIYNDWREYFFHMECDLFYFVIPTHNCQIFTIAVRMDDKLFYITPTHNYVIPLNRELLNNIIGWEECEICKGI